MSYCESGLNLLCTYPIAQLEYTKLQLSCIVSLPGVLLYIRVAAVMYAGWCIQYAEAHAIWTTPQRHQHVSASIVPETKSHVTDCVEYSDCVVHTRAILG